MYRQCLTGCWMIVYVLTALIPAQAHFPHDFHEFVALSPEFSADGSLFVAQHQGETARPPVTLLSRDRGNSWEYHPAGLDNLGLFTSAVVSPRYAVDNTVFMTNDVSGVFRSTDRGRSWMQLNDGLPTLALKHSAAAVDDGGQVVLLVSGIAGGLYRSADYGASWVTVISPDVIVGALAMSPDFDQDGTVLAGDTSGALFVSEDGGWTFSQRDPLTAAGPIMQIEFTPGYGSTGEIYLGTVTGLYFSDSRATSFTSVQSFGSEWVSALAVSPDYETDLTLFAATPTQGLFKSIDAGQTWTLYETGKELAAQTNYHFLDIEISDAFAEDATVFLATFEGLFRSENGGESWSELETRPPELIMDVALSSDVASDGIMLVSTYGGGLYVTQDAGATWEVSNLGVTQPYTYDVAVLRNPGDEPILLAAEAGYLLQSTAGGTGWLRKPTSGANYCMPTAMTPSPAFSGDQTVFLGCRQDGFKVTRDAGDTWQMMLSTEQLANGRISSIALSPEFASDATVFATHWSGFFLRSRDAGNSWEVIIAGLPAPWRFYGGTSIAVSPSYSTDSFLIASTPKGIYRSLDAGDRWWPTPDSASPVASGVIEFVGFSPNFDLDRTLLASVRGEGLFRSEDAGLSWQRIAIDSFESGHEIKAFAFSPDFAQDGVILGYGGGHLLRSTDRGDTFASFDIPFVRHEEDRFQTISYAGEWNIIYSEGASATRFAAARGAGKLAELTFWGTGVSWIGFRAEMLGIAQVYIDLQLVAVVDQYHPTVRWGESLYSISGLPEGRHQIHIVTTGERNADATSNWTLIDAFDVTR